ncbi:MAG TPA: copper resistance protein CopC, partial [Acidimicrobiales bacterium]|nr:copper resistance protein CopC [Acidimicrobiales bacterium]
LLLAVCATWASVPEASAHALLAASVPADGSSVEEPPTEVVLTFTEAPDPRLAIVRVLDAAGARMEGGKPEPVAGQPMQLRVPLGTLAKGTYTVTWRNTSAVDGHTTVGSVAFGVGVAVAATGGSESAEAGVQSPSPASIAGRWLFYVGVVLLLGAAVVGVAVLSTPSSVSVWALNGAWGATAIGLALTFADQRATARTSLGQLLQSATGHKLSTQAAAVGLAWVAVVWASLRPSRRSLAAVGAGAAAAMLARALSGHAEASSVPWFAVAVQWAHLVAVGAWVGGLVWLLLALRRDDPGRGRGLARRFSTVAGATLGVVAVTGALRALDEVGAWDRLVDTSFGVALLVKVALFAALAALGARNRFRHVPNAGAGRHAGLRRTVRAEVVIGAAVLGAAAVLAGLPPSASLAEAAKLQRASSLTVTGSDYATSVRIRLVVTPGAAGPNRFDATVVDYDSGQPAPAQTVTLRLQLDDRPDVGTATVELTRDPDGHWRGSSSALSIDGRWTVTALVQSAGDAVEVPMALVTSPRG